MEQLIVFLAEKLFVLFHGKHELLHNINNS